MCEFGLMPTSSEMSAIIEYFDMDKDYTIVYVQLLKDIQEPLSERRMNIVKKVFLALDRNLIGRTSILSAYKHFDISMNRQFLSNEKNKD